MTDEVSTAAESTVTVRDKAQAVVAVVAARPGLGGLASDTPFLDLITDLLTQLLPVLLGCFGGAAGAARELASPGPLVRVRVRLAVRRELGDRETVALLAAPLSDAILSVGRQTSARDLTAMIA